MSRIGRWLPLAAVLALLAAAMLSAAYANPTIQSVPPDDYSNGNSNNQPPPLEPEQLTQFPAAPPQDSSQVPAWVGWALVGLGALVVLGLAALLIRMLLRNKLSARRNTLLPVPPPTPPAETARQVRDALDEGLADLDLMDSDPRRVVIACWVRLEAAAAAAGIARAVGDTSTDLVRRLLTTSRVSPDLLGAFAAVYREARFATHIVDDAMRDQARAALTQLRDELALGVS